MAKFLNTSATNFFLEELGRVLIWLYTKSTYKQCKP